MRKDENWWDEGSFWLSQTVYQMCYHSVVLFDSQNLVLADLYLSISCSFLLLFRGFLSLSAALIPGRL